MAKTTWPVGPLAADLSAPLRLRRSTASEVSGLWESEATKAWISRWLQSMGAYGGVLSLRTFRFSTTELKTLGVLDCDPPTDISSNTMPIA